MTLITVKRIWLLLVMYTASLNGQVMLIDTIQNTLNKLKTELNAKYISYNAKYKTNGVALASLTFYEYNTENELIVEKVIAENDGYTLNFYQNKNLVKSVSTLLGHKKFILKKYDKEGALEQKKEYSDYFPDHEDIEVYKFTSVKNKTKDTVTGKSFVNGNFERMFIYVYDSGEQLKELSLYVNSKLRPDSKYIYYYTADKKHIEKEMFFNYLYKYEQQKLNSYNKDGLLERCVETNLTDNKKHELKYYYNEKKLLIKQEEFDRDSLTMIRNNEYDINDHRISEKAFNKKGEMLYQCLYEYDDKGNRLSYLYFHKL